jgi:hypothetical protein
MGRDFVTNRRKSTSRRGDGGGVDIGVVSVYIQYKCVYYYATCRDFVTSRRKSTSMAYGIGGGWI